MGSYRGRRMRRPVLRVAAFTCVVATVAACAALVATMHARAEGLLPWFAIGGMIAFYVLMLLSFRPAPATLEIAGDEVRVSWRARPIRAERVAAGRWVTGALDTPAGMLLEIRAGSRRFLRVGGEGHDARGYANEARPRRTVDLALTSDDFDRAAAELRVTRTADAGVVVELVRSSQSAGGLLRTMGPWLATIVVVSIFGVTIGVSGIGDRVPPMIVGAITTAMVLAGLGWTIVRSSRPRAPEIGLRLDEAGLVVTERGETTTIPWSAVRGAARNHVLRMKGSSWTMPALELALGERTLVFAGWTAKPRWAGEVPSLRRAPRWLAGTPQFEALVHELRRRRCLDE